MRRALLATLVLVVAGAACGKPLVIEPNSPDGADGGTMTLPDGAVVPSDGAVDPDARSDAATTDGAPGAATCAKFNACPPVGVGPATQFDAIDGPFVLEGANPAPTLDMMDFISPSSSLRTTSAATMSSGFPLASSVVVSTTTTVNVCTEVCMKIDVGAGAFGAASDDVVTIFRVDNTNSSPPILFGVQLAAGGDGLAVVIDSPPATDVMPVMLPRGRWFFLTVRLHYAVAMSTYEVGIEGSVHSKPFAPLGAVGTNVTTTIGTRGSGVHPGVVVHYDDFRLTMPP